MKLRTALLASLLALFAFLAVTGSASASVPRIFFGMEGKDIYYGDDAYRNTQLDGEAGIGVGLMRQIFDWNQIEQAPGVYRFRAQDLFVGEAAQRGIEIMPLLFNPPSFRSSRPPGDHSNATWPPSDYSTMGDFGAAVARRYGPNGSFWAENPTIPKVPIRRYQVWNEPHLPASWPPKPDPAQYAALLNATRPRIKAVDPGAEIVTGGISESTISGGISMRDFINGMYAAGGATGFDILGLHPYNETAAGSVNLVETARDAMRKNGDSRSPIWVTEVGWATGGPQYRFVTDEPGQAARLRDLYMALGTRADLGVRGIIWHFWRDGVPPPDIWATYTGLLRHDGTPKPSYFAYRDVVGFLSQQGLGAGGVLGSPLAASLPRDFVAVNAPNLIRASSAARGRALRSQAVIGVGALRQVFDWRRLERAPGSYSLAAYDNVVASAAGSGIRVIPVLDRAPRFYRSQRARRTAVAKLTAALAARYGPGGLFWREHADVPELPIRTWQIWQNPGSRRGWGGRPSARAYLGLLKAARAPIKAQDRNAEIVAAPSSLRFLSSLYRAGGRRSFDVVAVTPFARTAKGVVRRVRAVRRLMIRRHHRGGRVWIAGFGWSDRAHGPFSAGKRGQAKRISQTLKLLGRSRRGLGLRGITYVVWQDRTTASPRWARYAGLLSSRGRHKRAYAAFSKGLRTLR